jgi:hypothetical protein
MGAAVRRRLNRISGRLDASLISVAAYGCSRLVRPLPPDAIEISMTEGFSQISRDMDAKITQMGKETTKQLTRFPS